MLPQGHQEFFKFLFLLREQYIDQLVYLINIVRLVCTLNTQILDHGQKVVKSRQYVVHPELEPEVLVIRSKGALPTFIRAAI